MLHINNPLTTGRGQVRFCALYHIAAALCCASAGWRRALAVKAEFLRQGTRRLAGGELIPAFSQLDPPLAASQQYSEQLKGVQTHMSPIHRQCWHRSLAWSGAAQAAV